MRHGDRVKKLGRKKEHRLALLKNLCRSLFIFERIKTTLPKAKEAKKLAEHLIEFAKRNDLSAKRTIYRFIPDHKLVKIICEEIGPKFSERQGGYTRIYRLGPRLGDGAEMAILELVEQNDPSTIVSRRKLIERRKLVEEKSKKEKKKKVKKEKKTKEKKIKQEIPKKKKPGKKEKKISRKKKAKKEKKDKKASKQIKGKKRTKSKKKRK
ncbi:MAG: 50S ribosomal protein L17 [bacterium]|jgi:large subunit ribosomal protein L17